MANSLPSSNLPDRSLPWGRSIESELENLHSANNLLSSELAAERSITKTQAGQLETMQNYIKTICALSGLLYPPAAAPVVPEPAPAPDAPPASVSVVREFDATWSCTWYQSFKRTAVTNGSDDRLSMYQRGSGYAFAMAGFDIGPALGKTITKVELWMQNISTYYNGAFTAVFGTHSFASEPGSRPFVGRENGFDVGWRAGLGQWVDVGSWSYGALSNGSIRGFTTGDAGKDTQNFARFAGVGRQGAPKLRITYNS